TNKKLGGTNKKRAGTSKKLAGTNKKLVHINKKLAGTNKKLVHTNKKLAGTNKKLVHTNEPLVHTNETCGGTIFHILCAPGEVRHIDCRSLYVTARSQRLPADWHVSQRNAG
ncbi:MAG: hypothetical protein ACR2GY_07995, partial [Phycisphaerales bacterium]